jgi:hypothetical protein
MQRLHIFRAGRHTAMDGAAIAFAAADIAAIASGYDPAKHEAPIVVGHPALDAPAYGWVGGLAAEGGDLYATPRQVEPQFAAMVEAGRFKKISASFFAPQHSANPTPGAYYLKHVGFLGATAPAVKGLRPVQFAADEADTVTVEFAAPERGTLAGLLGEVTTILAGLRDRLVGAEPSPSFADPPAAQTATPPPERSPAVDDAARAAELQQQLEAANARLAQFAEAEDRRRREANRDFVEQVVREARLPAGLAPRATALLDALDAEATISFAEGERTLSESPRAALQALLRALPPRVALGEVNPPGPESGDTVAFAEVPGTQVDPERLALHNRVVAYQRAHPGTDYMTALRAVGVS